MPFVSDVLFVRVCPDCIPLKNQISLPQPTKPSCFLPTKKYIPLSDLSFLSDVFSFIEDVKFFAPLPRTSFLGFFPPFLFASSREKLPRIPPPWKQRTNYVRTSKYPLLATLPFSPRPRGMRKYPSPCSEKKQYGTAQ